MITAAAEGLVLTPSDNTTLERRFADGDAQAFEQVVALYQTRVARLASRLLGWRGDVEDVLQDVFLAALSKARSFRGESSLWTWLTIITLNRCRSQQRRAMLFDKFRLRRADAAADVATPADGSSIDDETSRQVRAAVASLPRIDREVIVLFYLEEQSVEQMSQTLGASRNAVEVRLHCARRKLKSSLANLATER